MKSKFCVFAALVVVESAIFAQSDRGTITGAVGDPAGAVVAGVGVQARNVDTGATYEAATTALTRASSTNCLASSSRR